VQPEPEPEPEPEVEAEAAEAASDSPASEGDLEVAPDSVTEEPAGEEAALGDAGPDAEVDAEDDDDAAEPAMDDGTPRPAVAARTVEQPGTAAAAAADRKGKARKRVREVVNLQEQEQFARQITDRGGRVRRVTTAPAKTQVNPRRKRRDKLAPLGARPISEQKKVIKVDNEISVGELAKLLGQKAPAIQGRLMALGTMVSINQLVDVETCRQVAKEFGFEVQDTGFKEEDFLEPTAATGDQAEEAVDKSLPLRAPVVTVMGHVDHGKTTLLDTLRKTSANVADGEAGGITQHVGAYQVVSGGHAITFIDTPGHAAFTAMRARGAKVTDLVVLVVAANDGVMPQTVEAIEHAQAAGVPIVVAVNKIDLPEADPDKVRQRLTEHNLVPEEFGGDIICVNVSAKSGEGIDQLIEMLALQAEVLELHADPDRRAKGVVLEARLDKGRGAVATVLVQEGTLRRGDIVVVGTQTGRVRVMESDTGEKVKEAGPSMPVQVVGLSDVPSAGAEFHVVESDRVAKQITSHREDSQRGPIEKPKPRLTLEEFFAQAEGGGPKELSVVLKTDVQGTCEAAREALEDLSTEEVNLRVLSSGVGAITENDVMLAKASDAIVLGFHVRPDAAARRAADNDGVDIRTYTVIMNLIDEVRAAMAGLLPPTLKEEMLGRAEVLQTFTIPKIGTIAGSQVIEGKVVRNARARLVRDGVQIYDGTIGSLRRFKDDVREVINGTECGIGIDNFNDIKIGDIIEVYEVEEVPATL
jgi:translation initiation factor IF-2